MNFKYVLSCCCMTIIDSLLFSVNIMWEIVISQHSRKWCCGKMKTTKQKKKKSVKHNTFNMLVIVESFRESWMNLTTSWAHHHQSWARWERRKCKLRPLEHSSWELLLLATKTLKPPTHNLSWTIFYLFFQTYGAAALDAVYFGRLSLSGAFERGGSNLSILGWVLFFSLQMW